MHDIVVRLREDWLFEQFGSDLWPSLRNLALGFSLAVMLGVTGGVILGLSQSASRYFDPLVHFLRSIPPPALLPVGLILFGITESMKIAVIAGGALWPTLLNSMDGVRAVDPQLLSMSRVYQFSRKKALFHVVLPAASPQIFAGIRTTLQISIIMVVVSEMVATTGGVGYYVLKAQQGFDITATWAGTILLGIIGYAANVLLVLFQRRLLWWQAASTQALKGGTR